MKGIDIAKNLRGSRRRWGTDQLFENGKYCVLGIKAAEAGVKPSTLRAFDAANDTLDYPFAICIYDLNDSCSTKQELISRLESPDNAKRDFPVERFVRMVLKFQEKLEKLQKKKKGSK